MKGSTQTDAVMCESCSCQQTLSEAGLRHSQSRESLSHTSHTCGSARAEVELDEAEQRGGVEADGGRGAGAGRRSPLVPRAVAERRVAAGDADGVQLSRAELLIARRRDQTRP